MFLYVIEGGVEGDERKHASVARGKAEQGLGLFLVPHLSQPEVHEEKQWMRVLLNEVTVADQVALIGEFEEYPMDVGALVLVVLDHCR